MGVSGRRRARLGAAVVTAVVLVGGSLAVGVPPAAAVGVSVGTVEEFWAAWTDPDVTQIDLTADIALVCPGEDTSPVRDPNGDTVVDGHGFTLTMTCAGTAVLASFGTYTLTVRDITLTSLESGNGIAMFDAGGDVVVVDSTITGNTVKEELAGDEGCGDPGATTPVTACIPFGAGIAAGGDVTVSGSTISHNQVRGDDSGAWGGGIFANGFLTITDSTVSDNLVLGLEEQFDHGGGGVFANGGALVERVEFRGNEVRCPHDCDAFGGAMVTGPATVTDSTFEGNAAVCDFLWCGIYGGGVHATGALTVAGSAFVDHEVSCQHGCGAYGAGVFAGGSSPFNLEWYGGSAYADRWGASGLSAGGSPGAVAVSDSSFSGNRATVTDEYRIYLDECCFGGGLAVEDETSVAVSGSAFSGNEAYEGGGAVWVGGGAPLTVVNSTITGNESRFGSVRSEGSVTLAYVTLADAVVSPVANEFFPGPDPVAELWAVDLGSFATVVTGGGTAARCAVSGTTTSDGWNFADDTSCGFVAATDSESVGNDPELGPLGDHGGPTATRVPDETSPLLDAVPAGDCQTGPATGITTDQRGVTRPQGTGCDIGAVEVAPPTPTTTLITSDAPDPSFATHAYKVSGTVTVEGSGPASGDLPGQVDVTGDGSGCTDPTLVATGNPEEFGFSCLVIGGPPGSRTLTATYGGSWADYAASADTEVHTIIGTPSAPTNVHATTPGIGRSTVVSWTPPPGPVPDGYQVRCIPIGLPVQTSPGPNSDARWASGPSSPVSVSGLTRGLSYHCKVRARYGPQFGSEQPGDLYEGPLSAWSNTFTVPIVKPPAPTGVRASTPAPPAARTTVVTWTVVPNDTGSPITFRTRCASTNGGQTRSATGPTPVSVRELTRRKTYTCTVTATNAAGSSTSAPSNSIRVP